ncbi:MAG: peptide chain release factor N(5)-glutamine methyltransferase [Gemmatimonadales bacterium]
MPSDPGTVRRALIDEAASALSLGGVEAPRREALRIWSDVSSEGEAMFQSAIRRRSAGEPLAHVTGRAGFRYLELASDRRALIPRPETEGLVELLLAVSRTGSVADVGTGSGCIALSLAQEGTYSQVIGTDISAEALALAGVNRDRCAGRVSLVRGDLGGPLRTGAFDALVSNPPYLTAQEYATLDPSVRDWEPRQALVGGTDGLETIARLLDEGRDVVRTGGWLALEVDCFRAAQCAGLAGALGWTDVAVHTDLFGRERYLLARRSHTQ